MKKYIIITLIWILTFGFWISSEASLDPMKLGVGARSLAMGRTSAAVSGDINSMFINPANAAKLKDWGVTSMYTSLLEGDIAYTLLGGGKKFSFGTLGLAYMGAGTSGIDTTTRDADSRITTAGSSFNYSNSVISLVYGKEIWKNLSVGGIFKSFNKSFSNQTGGTGSGYDIDLGLIYKPREELTLGLSQQNTLPASMGGKITWGTGLQEGIPFNTKFGLAYTPQPTMLIALDMDCTPNSPSAFHGGLEWVARNFLAIRGGFEQVPTSLTSVTMNYTAGVGLMLKNFNFDYAYYLDNVLNVNSTHYFTLSYVPREIKEEKKEAPSAPMFKDVPSDYWARTAIEHLAKKKIITGYSDQTFKPESSLSRAELCTLLIKAKGKPVSSPTNRLFKDVAIDHWAASYIESAVNLKLVDGYTDGNFKPGNQLSREEGIKIISLFDNLKKVSKAPSYADISANRWSAKYIASAQSVGWLYFIKGDKFEPARRLTRAEAAFVLYLTSFVQNQKK